MDQSFVPPSPPSPSLTTFQIWTQALTSPTEATYRRIVDDPNASLGRALLWVGVANFISTTVVLIIQFFVLGVSLPLEMLELGELSGGIGEFFAGSLIGLLCAIPISVVVGLVVFIVFVGMLQFVAGALGGQGDFMHLAYGLAAYAAPLGVLSSLFSFIPFVNLCLGLPLALYGIYLQALVIKTVNRFGWVSAIGTLVIPLILVILVSVVCVLLIVGPLIQQMMNDPALLDPSLIDPSLLEG